MVGVDGCVGGGAAGGVVEGNSCKDVLVKTSPYNDPCGAMILRDSPNEAR